MTISSTLKFFSKLFTWVFIFLSYLVFANPQTFAQSLIYKQTFGTGTSLPSGWSTSTPSSIYVSTSNPSPNGTAYSDGMVSSDLIGSAGSNLTFEDNATGIQTITVSGVISTISYTAIQVIWGASADLNSNFPGITAEWSPDGVSWTALSFADIYAADGTWYSVSQTTLSSGAENITDLQFRFSFTGTNSGGIYQLDDFRVQGIIPATSYYSKSTGFLNNVANWGTNTDGTGTSPANFTTAGSTFNVSNNANPTINANWTVSGSGSKVIVNTGSNFTLPSGLSYTGTIDVDNGGILTLLSNTYPSIGALGTSSTVVYGVASSPNNVVGRTYGNLTIQTSTHTLGGNIQVDGIFNLSSRLNIGTNTLTMNGTLTGAGTLGGTSSSNITIGGSGAFGTLVFAFSARNLATLTVNRSSSGTVTLGSQLTINTRLNLDNGTLVLNGNILTLSNSNIVVNTGNLRGSTSSNITFSGGPGSGGSLAFDQTSSSTRTLASLSINRSVTLLSDLDIGTSLALSSSTLDIGTNTLTLNSTLTLGGGSLISSATGTVIYNQGSNGQNVAAGTYGNLTFSNYDKTLASSGTIGIAGTFTTGTSTNHTVTGSTIDFNGLAPQTIPAFKYNNLTSSSTGTRTLASSGSISIAGTFTPGSNVYTITGSTIDYTSGAQTITAFTYNNLSISGTRTGNNVTLGSGTIDIAGIFSTTASFSTGLYVAGSGTVNFSGSGSQAIPAINYNNITNTGNGNRTLASSGTIGIAGSFTPGSGTYTTTGSTVDYNGTAQTIGTITYRNLTLSNSGIKTVSATQTVAGNLVISGTAALTPGSNTIYVGGNWTNYGTAGFAEGTSTVIFNGSTAQAINTTGGETFNNITIANTSGGVSLSDSALVVDYLTVNSGSTALTTNNVLRLLSTASKTASLIDNASTVNIGGSISGNLIDERYMSEVRSDTIYPRIASYFSAPVYNITANQLQSTALNFFYYEENKTPHNGTYANYQQIYTKVLTPSSEVMIPGKGYSIRIDRGTTVTKSFYGQPNNGTINLPVTFTNRDASTGDNFSAGTNGLNLVGNPYPSAIDWDLFTTKTNIDGTVYTWNGKQNISWNGITGSLTNGIIGSGQGFFVNANGTSPVLTVSNAARVSSAGANNTHYRVAGVEKPPVIKIEVAGNNFTDDTYLLFTKDATPGFDHGFGGDGYKGQGVAAAPMLYTTGGGEKLSINALPVPTTETIVPLGIQVGANGKYEFTAGLSDFDNSNLFVYLEDKELNIKQNLKSNPTYSFSRISADTTGRFNLIFKTKEITTGLDDIAVETETIKINSFEGTAYINSSKGLNKATIIVLDAMGNTLYKASDITSTGNYTIDLSKYTTGIYIIKVLTSGASKIEKVKNW